VALRDGFIVIGACIYFLGYIMWAVYAALEHLGNLPLLSTQYLTAGAIVGAFLAAAWFIGRGLWWFRRKIALWLDPNIQWRATVGWCLQIVSTLALLTALLSTLITDNATIMLIGIYIFAFTAFFGPEVKQSPNWINDFLASVRRHPSSKYYLLLISSIVEFNGGLAGLGIFYGWLFTLVLPLVALVVGFALFTTVPQELGGPQPSCTYLDLDRTMMSLQTQEDLIPKSDVPDSRVARSIAVDILFSGAESVLVRRHMRSSAKDRLVYEINAKLIMSKLECD